MAKLFELLFTGVFVVALAYVVARVFRPRTTREILGRPASFFERLQPTVDAYGEAESAESQESLLREVVELFEDGLRHHGLDAADFQLSVAPNEVGLVTGRVLRLSDGEVWSLQEFDDYLLSEPRPKG